MYCIHCGAENLDDARFCVACGKGVQNSKPGTRTGPDANSGETELGLIPGQVLSDRFEIEKVLGVGGMGRVYLARDRVLERPVAIKVLREVLSRDTGSVRRLVEEAKASIRLAHPNIVRVDDYHDAGTVKFLAMEYVKGENLADRLARERRLGEDEACLLAIEVCKGLEHAHYNRVIHRDLKPANILLGKDGAVKIADFGIARVARDSVSRLTSMQDSGTLLYMSPEQLNGKSSQAGDIYSLGVILYEMLTGDPPFHSGDVTFQIRQIPPPPLSDVSPWLEGIVMKCLEKAPENRFSGPLALREALQERSSVAPPGPAPGEEENAGTEVNAEEMPVPAPSSFAEPEPRPASPPVSVVAEPAPTVPPPAVPGVEDGSGGVRMILKQVLRGAFGFGLPIALPGFMIDGANGDDRMLLMLCAPPLAGILGALSLRLKKRGVIVIGLAFLGLGLALLAFEPTRYDFVDGYPYFLILFIFGGGLYGAFIGWRRWKEGLHGRPLPD